MPAKDKTADGVRLKTAPFAVPAVPSCVHTWTNVKEYENAKFTEPPFC
jgi:hypothetical protein